MINTKKVLDLMIKYKLKSLDEFILIYTIQTRDLESLIKYIENRNDTFSLSVIKDLVSKNILQEEPLKFCTEKIDFLDLYITDEFAKEFFVDFQIAGNELWEAYPNSTMINGSYVHLKKGDKIGNIYYDKDKLIDTYCKKIGYDIDKHKEVLDITKKAKDAGILNMALRSFIMDEMWDSIDVIKTQSYNNQTIL